MAEGLGLFLQSSLQMWIVLQLQMCRWLLLELNPDGE